MVANRTCIMIYIIITIYIHAILYTKFVLTFLCSSLFHSFRILKVEFQRTCTFKRLMICIYKLLSGEVALAPFLLADTRRAQVSMKLFPFGVG